MAVEFKLRRSDGIFASPFPRGRFVPGTVRLVHVSDFRHQRVVGVGVCEHGADRKEHLGDRESRTPLVSEDVKTDAAVGVDVGVVNPGGEVDLRRLEWVVGGEVDVQEENTS